MLNYVSIGKRCTRLSGKCLAANEKHLRKRHSASVLNLSVGVAGSGKLLPELFRFKTL